MGKLGKWIGVSIVTCMALYVTKEPACLSVLLIAVLFD
jgi:hypothetical protein